MSRIRGGGAYAPDRGPFQSCHADWCLAFGEAGRGPVLPFRLSTVVSTGPVAWSGSPAHDDSMHGDGAWSRLLSVNAALQFFQRLRASSGSRTCLHRRHARERGELPTGQGGMVPAAAEYARPHRAVGLNGAVSLVGTRPPAFSAEVVEGGPVGARSCERVVTGDVHQSAEERVAGLGRGADERHDGVLGCVTCYELAIADGQGAQQQQSPGGPPTDAALYAAGQRARARAPRSRR